jgi:prevent-host-death family protein
MYIVMYTGDMSRRYSIADARSSLPHIVDQAEAGVEVELTRRGRPVAVVVSRRTFDRLRERRGQFSEAYQRFLVQFSLDEIGFDQAEQLTTRDTASGRRVVL